MKNLIIYASHRGSVEKCAKLLSEKLVGDTHLLQIGKNKLPSLSEFDNIIIGGSIHAGNIQIKLQQFMANEGLILMTKRLGLFICCMYEGDTAKEQFNKAFPEALRSFATSQAIFGGEFDFEKMNFIERFIVRKVTKVDVSTSKLKMDEIERFAKAMNGGSL